MTKKFINLSRRFSRAATRASFRGKATLLSRLQHLPPAPPQRRPGTELPPPAGVGAGGWGIERGKQAPQSPPPRLSRSPQPGKETPGAPAAAPRGCCRAPNGGPVGWEHRGRDRRSPPARTHLSALPPLHI